MSSYLAASNMEATLVTIAPMKAPVILWFNEPGILDLHETEGGTPASLIPFSFS